MTPLKGNVFGPADIPLDLKIDLLNKKINPVTTNQQSVYQRLALATAQESWSLIK